MSDDKQKEREVLHGPWTHDGAYSCQVRKGSAGHPELDWRILPEGKWELGEESSLETAMASEELARLAAENRELRAQFEAVEKKWIAESAASNRLVAERDRLRFELGDERDFKSHEVPYAVASMRSLRRKLQERGLWRPYELPKSEGDGTGGTEGSAIECIDRLHALAALMRHELVMFREAAEPLSGQTGPPYPAWVARVRALIEDPDGKAAVAWLEGERAKAREHAARQVEAAGCICEALSDCHLTELYAIGCHDRRCPYHLAATIREGR